MKPVLEIGVASIIEKTGDIFSIDGKTIRGAKVNGKSPIHIVCPWSSDNIVLGQVRVHGKSNEITAIPEFLETLAIGGSVVTIDAMGCQKEIAQTICEKEADCVLGLKGNQSALLEEVQDEFLFSKAKTAYQDVDFGHGRQETRKCSVIQLKDFDHVVSHQTWAHLSSIIKIASKREFKNKDQVEIATKYYISSLAADPQNLLHIIRSPWEIENKLHWKLDIAFSEDYNRKRSEYEA